MHLDVALVILAQLDTLAMREVPWVCQVNRTTLHRQYCGDFTGIIDENS
jgi:hypothetical protein